MQQNGHFTGKRVFAPFLGKTVTIGKISGYRGTGQPVYDLMEYSRKVGEMGNTEIKKNRKLNK